MSDPGPEPPEWGDARETITAVALFQSAEAELLGLDPTAELRLTRLAGDLAVRRTARDSLLVAVHVRGEDGDEQRELFAAHQDVRRVLAELHATMHADDDPTPNDPEDDPR